MFSDSRMGPLNASQQPTTETDTGDAATECVTKTLLVLADILETLSCDELATQVKAQATQASEKQIPLERASAALAKVQALAATSSHDHDRDAEEKSAIPMLKSLLGSSTYFPRHTLREITQTFTSRGRGSPRPASIRAAVYPRYSAPGAPLRAQSDTQNTSLSVPRSGSSPVDSTSRTQLPKSETYLPRPPGQPRESDPFDPADEYRDDDDPGYRIRDLWEADLIHELQLRERGDPDAARIPFCAAFSRQPDAAPDQRSTTSGSSVTQRRIGADTGAHSQHGDAVEFLALPHSDTPNQSSQTHRSLSYSSPDPSCRGGSLLSSVSNTTRRSVEEGATGMTLTMGSFGTQTDGVQDEAAGSTANLASSTGQARQSSPTFGAEDVLSSTENLGGQHDALLLEPAATIAAPSFGPDLGDYVRSPSVGEVGGATSPATTEEVSCPEADLVCHTALSPQSPEFGTDPPNQDRLAPVADDIFATSRRTDTEEVPDELAFCSAEGSTTSGVQHDAPSSLLPLSRDTVPAVHDIFPAEPSLYNQDGGAVWRAEYADGNFALQRLKMAKKKQSALGSLIHPPSGDPQFPIFEDGKVTDCFNLKIIFERGKTGFEEFKDFQVKLGTCIAGRYIVESQLGQAQFSKALRCYDKYSKTHVCMKVIRNDKDYVDQSLDEIKLLRYINCNADVDMVNCLRLLDFFYFKEHLILVTEMLKENLYEFGRKCKERKEQYFTMGHVQRIAYQVLQALDYIHSLHLIHSDLKPENILIKTAEPCQVKVIDFGSSCFVDDQLSLYVQSRSYRAPEVVLGLPYDQKIDIWSLGCILAELWTGYVLFQNESVASLLARIVGIIGPLPPYMVYKGQHVSEHFTQDGQLFQVRTSEPPCPRRGKRIRILLPKPSSLRQRMRTHDTEFVDFLTQLLQLDPTKRPTARDAFQHPWLQPGRYSDGL